MYRTQGLGFSLSKGVKAVSYSGASSYVKGPSGSAASVPVFEPSQHLKDLKTQAKEAADRMAAADTTRGRVIRYALFGGAGLLLAGAVTVWILSRKKGA